MLRPYGPGKFNTILDSYVWSVSLDGGCDDEIGDCDGGSWYGLMRHGRSIFRDNDPFHGTLNEEEREALTSSAGVILREDSQGFVYVTYFDTTEKLDAEWARIVAENTPEEESQDS